MSANGPVAEVCAIVVTCNRRELLRECLQALLAQSRPIGKCIVVDNASSDDTLKMILEEFPSVEVLHLTENRGGAGGFHVGMKEAYDDGYEWFWLLDDDTIATPSALEELLDKQQQFPAERRPQLLASKVLWTDGSLHFMNGAVVKIERDDQLLAAENSTLLIRSCTFVSCLVHRDLVSRYGLPVADYFIWGDDTEFTTRVLRENLGVMVPRSIVVHKTARKHTALDAAPQRFYYHLRNSLWIILRSEACTTKEKFSCSITLMAWIGRYLKRARPVPASLAMVFRGLRDGFFTEPRERDLEPLIQRHLPKN